jgi:hypothetical protein
MTAVRRHAPLALLTLTAAALTGCGGARADFTVNGTVEIALYQSDSWQEYAQAWQGDAQVTVPTPRAR